MESTQGSDLGQRFAMGDEAELEEIIAEHGAALFRYCYHVLCDYHAAEDVVQTVFIRAYSNRGGFKGESALSTWLHRIAYNACIDHLRRNKPVLPLFAAEHLPAGIAEIDEFGQEVMEALNRLTPLERTVIYGRIVEEKTYAELAFISGESEPALRKRYERAKRKLADDLRTVTQFERRKGYESI